ncbi:MAG: hypothetical protein FIB06_04550 [Betaproteobacteria bacterium]|nr:hypothetical protein [Betaproteobacteria bacterium]
MNERLFNIRKRTGRYNDVLYAHTTIEMGRIWFHLSRWHERGDPRRDYRAEFGYWDRNAEGILNPNFQMTFHRDS